MILNILKYNDIETNRLTIDYENIEEYKNVW